MKQPAGKIKAAVVQAAPVLFDKTQSIDKACRLIKKSGDNGAGLVLLPEAFIPAYPRGFSFGMTVGSRTDQGRSLWELLWDNAVDIPGPGTARIGKAVKQAGVYTAVGVIERDTAYSGGTLYCTLLYFDKNGTVMGKHRKLLPTGSERLIWGQGDGSTMPVFDTDAGRIGGLICWENYMPLARMALYGKGVQLFLAPTADARDTWQATLCHIALEGRCFVLGCNQFVTKDMYPASLPADEEISAFPQIMCRGGSSIYSPSGKLLAGPLWDREGILYANLDLAAITRAKLDFDVTGHYARPDVFRLIVNSEPQDTVSYE